MADNTKDSLQSGVGMFSVNDFQVGNSNDTQNSPSENGNSSEPEVLHVPEGNDTTIVASGTTTEEKLSLNATPESQTPAVSTETSLDVSPESQTPAVSTETSLDASPESQTPADGGVDSQTIGAPINKKETPLSQESKKGPVLKLDLDEIQSDFTILGDHITEKDKEKILKEQKSTEKVGNAQKNEDNKELFSNYESSFGKRRDYILKQVKRMKNLAKTNFSFIFSSVFLLGVLLVGLSYLDPKIHNVHNYKANIVIGYHKVQNIAKGFTIGSTQQDAESFIEENSEYFISKQNPPPQESATNTGENITENLPENTGAVDTENTEPENTQTISEVTHSDITETNTTPEIQPPTVIVRKNTQENDEKAQIVKEKIKNYFFK